MPHPHPTDGAAAAPHVACCVDDSPGGLLPVALARRLWGGHARLTLVHVAPHPLIVRMVDGVPVTDDDDINAQERSWLAGLARREPDAEPVFLEGAPGPSICAWATEAAPDVVVAAAHQRGGLQRALLGSVTRHLVDHCPRPVLVVRMTDDTPAARDTQTTTEASR